MKLAFRRSTGEVIPDFQDTATADVLLKNAIAAGIDPDDVEVREVSKESVEQLKEECFREVREAAALEAAATEKRAADLQKRMGWTDEDVHALRVLLRG